MIGGCGGDPDRTVFQHDAALALDHLGARPPLQIIVVGHAVADVDLEHGLCRLQERRRADGTVDGERLRLERRDPLRGDDVVQVGGVIAVQVRQKEPAQRPGRRSGSCGPHEDAAPAVEEQITGGGAHKGRGPGAQRVGQRAAAAEDDGLHGIDLLTRKGGERIGCRLATQPDTVATIRGTPSGRSLCGTVE
jgi:hypothetical protein